MTTRPPLSVKVHLLTQDVQYENKKNAIGIPWLFHSADDYEIGSMTSITHFV